MENKNAYIVHNRSTRKTQISYNVVFYEGGWVGSSEVHVTISNPKESNEKIDITVNTGPDLEVSWNYGSKVLAENLPNTTSEDSSTELAVERPEASAFNILIPVAVLNPPSKVHRFARSKHQPIYDDNDHYQKSFYKYRESSQKSWTITSGAVEGETEEIVKVTRAVDNELVKIANIDLDTLTYAEAVSYPDGA